MKSAWFGSVVAASAICCVAAGASARDYTYLLTVDYGPGESSIHEDNPDATVRVWATRDDSDFAWGWGNLDLSASEAGWTDYDIPTWSLFHLSEGELSADKRTVSGIATGQWGDLGECFEKGRPTLIWEGTWSNLTADYSSRTIALATSNTTFYSVYLLYCHPASPVSRLDLFTPGAGAITITPAPGAIGLALLAGASFSARRRRGP